MNILITGATGFIASQVAIDLLAAGHSVNCCVRNTAYAKNLFPHAKIISCNFVKDTSSDIWLPRVKNIDVVINCVGILHHPNKKIIWAIHHDTPCALFDACVTAKVKQIIQISALGIDNVNVDYASSKKAADNYLLTLPILGVILRPSLVYGKGSYGGTSLFRGLVGLPFIIPVPGKGEQEFQPIHLKDLSKTILKLIEIPPTQSSVFNATGPDRINLRNILTKMRAWLGFKSAIIVPVPLWFIRISSLFGNLLPNTSMNATSYTMLKQNNVTSKEEVTRFNDAVGFIPQNFITGLYSEPSTVQDHWHAKLYFLKPLLQLSIGFIWILSGICSAWLLPKESMYSLLTLMDIRSDWQPVILYCASALDILLGMAMLLSYQLKKVGIIQCGVIIIYTIIITWKLPGLWLEPFAAIAKNIPLLVATFILIALESDR